MTSNIVRDITDAWRSHDIALFASYLPNDFVLEVLVPDAFYPFSGTYRGKNAVLERYQNLALEFDVKKVGAIGLLCSADKAAFQAPIEYRHRESGMPLNTTVGCFWQIEGGWPVKLTQYHDLRRLTDFFHALEQVR